MLRLALSAALLCLFVGAATAHAVNSVLPWIEDDYAKALAEARARKVPIFLEAWAPWCHSCRSMQAFVYTDTRLAPYAERFVWLAIDTEKAQNAATIAKYPVGAWPSMYVIDPAAESVDYRWTGSATIEQLKHFLDEAGPAEAKRKAPSSAAATAIGAAESEALEVALVRADKLNGAAAWDAAATAYGAILDHAPAAWPSLSRTADAYLFALIKADRNADCARAARRLLPRLEGSPSSGSIAAMGLDCALELEATATDRATAIVELESASHEALANEKLGLAVDDRSGIYMSLISAREEAKDEEGKQRLMGEWIALLENAAAAAANPDARAVFDSHRLSAYLEAGEPERAIPMLEASEGDLPGDYNPPARLSVAFLAMKQYDKALAASDRALAKAYGPRRLGILRTRAKIELAMGDRSAAGRTLTGAIVEAEALPEGQRSERQIASLRKELDALSQPAKS